MADTTFIDYATPITAEWLNDINDKSYGMVTPQDFMTATERDDVESGAGTIDVSAAFNSALATGKAVRVPGGSVRKYLIGDTITVPSGARIIGERSLLQLDDSVDNHVITLGSGSDNIEISGLRIDCNKVNNTAGNGITSNSSGATNIHIRDNVVFNAVSHGISFFGTTINNITVTGNTVYGCGKGGITAGDTVSEFAFNNNMCWENGTHGVGILGIGLRGTINDNVCFDNGQEIPTADNLTGYNNSCRDLVIANNVSYGGLNNGIHFGGNNITVTGNTVVDATQHGIAVSPASGTVNGIIISDNNIRGSGLSGLRVIGALSGSISGNVCESNAQDGLALDVCQNLCITGNTFRANTRDGFRTTDLSTGLTITGNTVTGNGAHGLNIAEIAGSIISQNVVTGNTSIGINSAGAEGTNLISNNKVTGNGSAQIDTLASTSILFGNDTGSGTGVVGASSIIGGYDVGSNIIYKTTTGVGNSAAKHTFQVGNNGATTALVLQNDGKAVFGGTSTAVANVTINATSGTDALAIMNSSLTSRGWEFYNVTNSGNTDLRLFEFAGSSGDRAIFKSGGELQWLGDVSLTTAGKGLRVKEGSNCKQGSTTLVAGASTVANTSVTANSRILLTSNVDGGTPGWLRVSARVAGTSFTITSSSGTDTSTVAWQIFEPA